MKQVTIYSSDFADVGDWQDFLEELDYDRSEMEIIEEVELAVVSSSPQDNVVESKKY